MQTYREHICRHLDRWKPRLSNLYFDPIQTWLSPVVVLIRKLILRPGNVCSFWCIRLMLFCFPFRSFSLTTFSPSGKLVQIEHALAAVQAGATSLGIKGMHLHTVQSLMARLIWVHNINT